MVLCFKASAKTIVPVFPIPCPVIHLLIHLCPHFNSDCVCVPNYPVSTPFHLLQCIHPMLSMPFLSLLFFGAACVSFSVDQQFILHSFLLSFVSSQHRQHVICRIIIHNTLSFSFIHQVIIIKTNDCLSQMIPVHPHDSNAFPSLSLLLPDVLCVHQVVSATHQSSFLCIRLSLSMLQVLQS